MDLLWAFLGLLHPLPFLLILLGTVSGIVVGAIPGLTGAMLIALTLPLTFYMDPVNALSLLVAMYVGAISGALITATLLRMPGTAVSIMTTLDGYPMARGGKAGRALGLGITASFVGGLVSWLFLVTLTEPLSVLALRFGPFEYFSMVMMAMVLIASVSQGSLIKGLISGFLGMLVATPGLDPSQGQVRLTFGFHELEAGFNLLPVLIGVFAISQVISDVVNIDERLERMPFSTSGILLRLADFRQHAWNLLRSSLIGTWIGILPGIGAQIGSIVAYGTAREMSKTPEKFGTGCEDGIVASETANNATIGGALIPLIAMGIPGSVIDAILLGALIIHRLQPGPLLFTTYPHVVYAMMASMLIATILSFVILSGAVKYIAQIMYIRRGYLLPPIVVFCVLGSFALHNRMFDMWVMLGFGLVGIFLERAKVPLGPFVIGLVLAPIAEENLRSGLMISAGSYLPLVSRPISLLFLVASAVMLLWPFVKQWRKQVRKSQ